MALQQTTDKVIHSRKRILTLFALFSLGETSESFAFRFTPVNGNFITVISLDLEDSPAKSERLRRRFFFAQKDIAFMKENASQAAWDAYKHLTHAPTSQARPKGLRALIETKLSLQSQNALAFQAVVYRVGRVPAW